MEATTLNGKNVKIMLPTATVNGASIVTADIETTNGVIHVIDAVLLPPADANPKTGYTSSSIYMLFASLSALGLTSYFMISRRKKAEGIS